MSIVNEAANFGRSNNAAGERPKNDYFVSPVLLLSEVGRGAAMISTWARGWRREAFKDYVTTLAEVVPGLQDEENQ